MAQRRIPSINDTFDPTILTHILKKYFFIVVLLVFLSGVFAFLFMRYTSQVFNALSIVQINEENKASKVLKLESFEETKDLSSIIELIRSKEFLKRTFAKLPLNVRYFSKGTFLSSELYRSTPYKIQYEIKSPSIYNIPIFIYFNEDQSFIVKYESGGNVFETQSQPNKWFEIDGALLKLTITNFPHIEGQLYDLKQNEFFFILKNPKSIVYEHMQNLNVYLLNRYAKTIAISYNSNNAILSTEIVNTIAKEYIKYDIEKKKESTQNILEFIDNQLGIVYKNMDETEKQLQQFRKENKINMQYSSATSPFPIFTAKINEFEEEMLNIEFELAALDRINDQINDSKSNYNVYDLIAILSGTKSETILTSILNNLQLLLNKREQLLNDVTLNNHKIKVIDKQLITQKDLLLNFVNISITRLQSRKIDYEKKINEYEQKLFNETDYNGLEFNKLDRLYTINEGFYNQLIQKKAEYLISQAGYVSENEILEIAETPRSPVYPVKEKIFLIFILSGVFLGISIILLKYLFYNEITSIQNLRNYTNAPILGGIPTYHKELPVSQLLVNKNPNSIHTEAFRTLRSNLQFISKGLEKSIVAISSTIAGEGKTFISINLAGIIALAGKKVILLDLDLRKPRIHKGFDVPNKCGVSTILINRTSINNCIFHSEIPNFDFITAGPIPPNPSELIIGKQMNDLIEELKKSYDLIIIDTPPIGIVSDALEHFKRADYPIYVLKSNLSKRTFIENIDSLIEEKEMSNLSLVLNATDFHYSGTYRYGYSYGYGYYEEEEKKGKKILSKFIRKGQNK